MEVLGDVVARDRRSGSPALRVPAVGRRYDYRRFCTTTWKVGNFLRYLGVRRGAGVAIADDPLPEPVSTFYGAGLLGAVARFGSPEPTEVIAQEVRALVVPAEALGRYECRPTTKRVAYGGRPGDPTVAHFERDVWSENPTEPPDRVSPDDPLLRTAGRTYTHAQVLATAASVVEAWGLGQGSVVAVAGPFTDPGVVAAGLVAPLVAGAEVVLVDRSAVVDGDPTESRDTGVAEIDDSDADSAVAEASSGGPTGGVDGAPDLVVGGPDSDVDTDTLLPGAED